MSIILKENNCDDCYKFTANVAALGVISIIKAITVSNQNKESDKILIL